MRVRFDFVDGPLSIPPVSSEVIGRRLARRWFDEDTPREDKGASLRRSRPIGFDASVQHVLQIWRTGKGAARSSFVGDGLGDYGEGEPYDGIIGFGQGAALASWLAREGVCDGLRFVILVGGYEIDVDGVHLDGGYSDDDEELLDGDSFATSLLPLPPGTVALDAPIKNTSDNGTGEWDGNNEFYDNVGVSSLHIIGKLTKRISNKLDNSSPLTYGTDPGRVKARKTPLYPPPNPPPSPARTPPPLFILTPGDTVCPSGASPSWWSFFVPKPSRFSGNRAHQCGARYCHNVLGWQILNAGPANWYWRVPR